MLRSAPSWLGCAPRFAERAGAPARRTPQDLEALARRRHRAAPCAELVGAQPIDDDQGDARKRRDGGRDRPRRALGIGAAALLTLSLLVAWRLRYYGYPLPSTYYMKVSGDLAERLSSGIGALFEVGARQGLVVHMAVLAGYAVAALGQRGRRVFQRFPFEAFFGIAWLCYFVYVGGDVLFDRLPVPIFPLGIFLALRWSQEWSGGTLARTRLALRVAARGQSSLRARGLAPFPSSRGCDAAR